MPEPVPTRLWTGGLRGESKRIAEVASTHLRQPRRWPWLSRADSRRYTRSISKNPGTPCPWPRRHEFETKPAECANTRARRCWRNDNPGMPAAAQREPAPGRSSLPVMVSRPAVFRPPGWRLSGSAPRMRGQSNQRRLVADGKRILWPCPSDEAVGRGDVRDMSRSRKK